MPEEKSLESELQKDTSEQNLDTKDDPSEQDEDTQDIDVDIDVNELDDVEVNFDSDEEIPKINKEEGTISGFFGNLKQARDNNYDDFVKMVQNPENYDLLQKLKNHEKFSDRITKWVNFDDDEEEKIDDFEQKYKNLRNKEKKAEQEKAEQEKVKEDIKNLFENTSLNKSEKKDFLKMVREEIKGGIPPKKAYKIAYAEFISEGKIEKTDIEKEYKAHKSRSNSTFKDKKTAGEREMEQAFEFALSAY